MYAYFQCQSELYEGKRLFNKGLVNFTKLGNYFGFTRQTASTRFKNLKDLGLIQEYNNEYYELMFLENNLASLVPYDTLKLITDTLNQNTISIYIYLLNTFYANKEQGFQISLEQLKKYIGICSTTRSNDDIVTNILFLLQKIGLIDYKMSTMVQKDDIFQNIKTIYEVTMVRNKINC